MLLAIVINPRYKIPMNHCYALRMVAAAHCLRAKSSIWSREIENEDSAAAYGIMFKISTFPVGMPLVIMSGFES